MKQGVQVRPLCRQNESKFAYYCLALTSIFGLCFMPVCLIKSNYYSLIYFSLLISLHWWVLDLINKFWSIHWDVRQWAWVCIPFYSSMKMEGFKTKLEPFGNLSKRWMGLTTTTTHTTNFLRTWHLTYTHVWCIIESPPQAHLISVLKS